MKYLYIVFSVVLLASCGKQEKPKEWVYKDSIKIKGVNPIGIANANGKLWLSDGDHNRLVLIDEEGHILKTIDSLDRPMHIDASGDVLFIPQYGNDKIETYDRKGRFELQIKDSLDAPAGIGLRDKEKAIADFYNNRILYTDGNSEDWISFGREGSHEGEFYYPTDVQITDSLIWVADAYNNRIQVFDKKGNFVRMMGQEQKMNAATGLFVSEMEVFITDFEHNRVLIFDHDGNLRQELKEGIAKATDLLIKDEILHIINYRSGELVLYDLQEKKIE
jgi:DNA-binding beta-propeller fold protein YncE